MLMYVTTNELTASGMLYTGKCIFTDLLIGMDGTNDPAVSAFDGTDNTGREVLPTNTYDASKLGLNGVVWQFGRIMHTGIYILIALAAGDVEVVGGYRPWSEIVGNLGSAYQPIR